MFLFAAIRSALMPVLLIVLFSFLGEQTSIFPYQNLPAVSHQTWNELLKENVNAYGSVDYKNLLNEKNKLQGYLDMLSKNPPQKTWSRNDSLAFWINAYNAFTVKLIIDNYPIKSIRDITDGKPWDLSFIKIGEKMVSLNYIENEVLRKKFGEPRIHFAINCASKSCPRLLNEAFVPEKIEEQLDRSALSFVRDKNSITQKSIRISKIFDWYKEDFLSSGGVIAFLNKYAEVKISPNASVEYLDYDWSLNE